MLVGWLVSGAPTFVIWHHSSIHSSDLAPPINSELVLVSSAKVKAFYAIDNKVNQFDNNIKIEFSYNLIASTRLCYTEYNTAADAANNM